MSCLFNIPSNMKIKNKFRRLQCCTKCVSCGAVSTVDYSEYDKAEKLLIETCRNCPIVLYTEGE